MLIELAYIDIDESLKVGAFQNIFQEVCLQMQHKFSVFEISGKVLFYETKIIDL